MEQQDLAVETRTPGKKGAARKLRASGRVPGVLYGHKQEPVHLSVDPKQMTKVIKGSGAGRNTVFKLNGLDRDVLALMKDSQVHPFRRNLLHVDLIEVREGDRVTVEVPLEFSGRPAGVVLGGVLEVTLRRINIECSALAIPTSLDVNVEPMEIGAHFHIGDLELPEGLKAIDDHRLSICAVKAPKAEAEEKPEGEEGAEVEGAPAEGAEAAPAAES